MQKSRLYFRGLNEGQILSPLFSTVLWEWEGGRKRVYVRVCVHLIFFFCYPALSFSLTVILFTHIFCYRLLSLFLPPSSPPLSLFCFSRERIMITFLTFSLSLSHTHFSSLPLSLSLSFRSSRHLSGFTPGFWSHSPSREIAKTFSISNILSTFSVLNIFPNLFVKVHWFGTTAKYSASTLYIKSENFFYVFKNCVLVESILLCII